MGKGNPKKSVERKQGQRLAMYLTAREKMTIRRAARAAGEDSVSAWARAALLAAAGGVEVVPMRAEVDQ